MKRKRKCEREYQEIENMMERANNEMIIVV